MGASASSDSKNGYGRARSCFTTVELSYYDKLFKQLVHASKADGGKDGFISWDGLESSFGQLLDKSMQKKIYDALCAIENHRRSDGHVKMHNGTSVSDRISHESFIIGMEEMIKGTSYEKAQVFVSLCEKDSQESVRLDSVGLISKQCISIYFKVISQSPIYALWHFDNDLGVDALVDFYNNSLNQHVAKSGNSADSTRASSVLVEQWLCHSGSVLLEAMSVTCQAAFNEILSAECYTYPVIPAPTGNKKSSSLLNLASLIILCENISTVHTQKDGGSFVPWRLVYNSVQHGESFTNLLKAISDEGPLLFLVKEKQSGYIFGGYVSVNMSPNPNFVGDDHCFLFSLHPRIRVYLATGYDNNYAYFNAYQATLPDGLGFGGRLYVDEAPVHFFALWLDQDFGKGKSQAGSCTYSSPQLSKDENFQLEMLEIWAWCCSTTLSVYLPELSIEIESYSIPDICITLGLYMAKLQRYSKSVLDTNPELKAILAMTGKGPASEGLRDDDDTADIPEERKLSIL